MGRGRVQGNGRVASFWSCSELWDAKAWMKSATRGLENLGFQKGFFLGLQVSTLAWGAAVSVAHKLGGGRAEC